MQVEQGKEIVVKLQNDKATFLVLRIDGVEQKSVKVTEASEIKVELLKKDSADDELVKKMRALKINDDVQGFKVDFVGFEEQIKDLTNLLQLKIEQRVAQDDKQESVSALKQTLRINGILIHGE